MTTDVQTALRAYNLALVNYADDDAPTEDPDEQIGDDLEESEEVEKPKKGSPAGEEGEDWDLSQELGLEGQERLVEPFGDEEQKKETEEEEELINGL